jgi:hypothetical protein
MTLPAPLAAALDRLGLPAPREPEWERPRPAVWKPEYPGQEPPF